MMKQLIKNNMTTEQQDQTDGRALVNKIERIEILDQKLDRMFYGIRLYIHEKFLPSLEEIKEDDFFRYEKLFGSDLDIKYLHYKHREFLPLFHEYELVLRVAGNNGSRKHGLFKFKSIEKFILDFDEMIFNKSYPTMELSSIPDEEDEEPVVSSHSLISPYLTLEKICDDKYDILF